VWNIVRACILVLLTKGSHCMSRAVNIGVEIDTVQVVYAFHMIMEIDRAWRIQ